MLAACCAYGQGTLVYDQQSVTTDTAGSGPPYDIQPNQPIGQSFTPTLSSVGFIGVNMRDENPGNSLGATVYLDLWSSSIGGTFLGSTDPISMPDGYGSYGYDPRTGVTYFFFSTPISVTPGVTYYFQPMVESGGDIWGISGYHFFYAGGEIFVKGTDDPNFDLWFREGVVPEPSSAALILIGMTAFYFRNRKTQQSTTKEL
ncbi:MAG: PEP-CTERM sorting domain-containing protein [Limisphaerales bacterium]